MEKAKDTDVRDMLDEVGKELRQYESEMGTKQSFTYEVHIKSSCFYFINLIKVRHFYKKLYFNPGINSPVDQFLLNVNTPMLKRAQSWRR